MCSMSTDPAAQDGAVPPEAADDSDGTDDASLPALPEQIYEQAMARLAGIMDEWRQARDALLRG